MNNDWHIKAWTMFAAAALADAAPDATTPATARQAAHLADALLKEFHRRFEYHEEFDCAYWRERE